ncbi:hypothetical protein FRC08_000868 [Ceratobasidium sp. 394]|nr:hypothetical protein FRC08_000868 [Ceratobasidium sp. 394]
MSTSHHKSKCRIVCTPGTHTAWFTLEETAWLETFLPEIARLTEQSGKGVGKARSAFYDKIREDFTKKFPYRDPEAYPQYEYSPEQRALAMKQTDRELLRGRIRSKLSLASHNERAEGTVTKLKPRPPHAPGSSKSVGDDVPSPPPTIDDDDEDVEDEHADDRQAKTKAAEKSRRHAQGDAVPGLVDILQHLGLRYETSAQDKTNMNWVLKTLGEMTDKSWAAIDKPALQERQGQLMLILRHLLTVLQHTMGVELAVQAVYHDGKTIQVTSESSSRLTDFEFSNRAEASRKAVFQWAKRKIGKSRPATPLILLDGSSITTNVNDALPAVFGNPDCDMHPMLPPMSSNWLIERRVLRTYFEYIWMWQGGHLPVPWDRIRLDGETGNYYMVQRHRMPESISHLLDSLEFSEQDTWTWAKALHSIEHTGSFLFQFRQVRPGEIEEETRTSANLARLQKGFWSLWSLQSL